jgi:hypothetical protein
VGAACSSSSGGGSTDFDYTNAANTQQIVDLQATDKKAQCGIYSWSGTRTVPSMILDARGQARLNVVGAACSSSADVEDTYAVTQQIVYL